MRLASILLLACVALPATTLAQRHLPDLSEAEENEVRDAADDPARRVTVYQAIIEKRVATIQSILANTRAQGRREDLRSSMSQIAGLIDELEDNLEGYDRAHRDLRKPLPKLQDAMVRWESVLRQPPDDDTYNLVRKLALEALTDVKAEVRETLTAQQAYFKAHPPDKNANPGGVGPIER